MNNITRLSCLFLLLPALALAILLPACSNQEPVRPAPETVTPGKLILVHTNDLHGQMLPLPATWIKRAEWQGGKPPLAGGAAAITAYLGRVRAGAAATGDQVLYLDSGDWFQGTPEGGHEGGMLMIEWFNRMGCAAATVGNHDYDFGWRNLVRLTKAAKFPILGANVTPKKTAEPGTADYVKPYFVQTVKGVRILFFGLILKGAKAVTGGDIGPISFAAEEKTFRAWLPRMREAADQIILLTHCGYGKDKQLAKALGDVKKLKLILGGHSHTRLTRIKLEGHIRIFQTGGKGTSVNHIELQVLPAKKEIRFSKSRVVDMLHSAVGEDPATKLWLANRTKKLRAIWDVPVGEISADLRRTRARRSGSAGNLVADATRLAAKATIGFTNKGGLRCNLTKGPITRRDVFQLLPFDNAVMVMDLSGAQVEKMVTRSFQRSALEISGIKVEYTGKKITRILLNDGSPLVAKQQYTVAMNSYMAGQGDHTGVCKNAKNRLDTGIIQRDALLALIKAAGGVVKVPLTNRYIKQP